MIERGGGMNIVRELRKRAGIQQKELALIVGVAQPTVSEWELNKKDPSGERLKKLAEFFGVDELIILGTGVIDLSKKQEIPQTPEARIISGGVDKLPKEQREQALAVMRAMFAQYADYFKERTEDHDNKL